MSQNTLLLLVILLSLILLLLTWLLLKVLRESQSALESQNQMMTQMSSDQASTMLAMAQLLTQTTNLIASQDALTFQALMTAVPSVYPESSSEDNSEEEPLSDEEFALIVSRVERGEVLTDNERTRFERAALGL